MQVLAADVGATKTIVALTEVNGDKVEVLKEERVFSQAWSSLEALMQQFLSRWNVRPAVASFAVAGTVHPDQTCFINRLDWQLSAEYLSCTLGVKVKLTYDACATAAGIALLNEGEVVTIRPGLSDPTVVQTVVCLGTGFGAAMRIPESASRYCIRPTRSGLMGFAPVGHKQEELISYLKRTRRCDEVNFDMLLGGDGLQEIVRFIVHDGINVIVEEPATIVEAARIPGNNPRYEEAVKLLARMYGQAAGNLALAHSATGGVYLAGGLSIRLQHMITPEFFVGFDSHGRAQNQLAQIPIHLVLNEKAPLLGAAVLGWESVTR